MLLDDGAPFDEILAVAGLSMKLFTNLTPDWCALYEALESVMVGAPSLSLLARAFCLFRIVRGAAGVAWAALQLSDPVLSSALLDCKEHADALQRSAARLLCLAERQAVSRGLSHREGRHLCHTGVCALQALATRAGGAARAVTMLEVVTAEIIGPRSELSRGAVLLAISAWEGRMPLAAHSSGNIRCAGPYIAMNAGFGLLAWARRSGWCNVSLDSVAFKQIMDCQSEKARQHFRDQGVSSFEDFLQKQSWRWRARAACSWGRSLCTCASAQGLALTWIHRLSRICCGVTLRGSGGSPDGGSRS